MESTTCVFPLQTKIVKEKNSNSDRSVKRKKMLFSIAKLRL